MLVSKTLEILTQRAPETTIGLNVFENRYDAIRLYERFQFHVTGRVGDLLYMEREPLDTAKRDNPDRDARPG